jgi:hypothetical protein
VWTHSEIIPPKGTKITDLHLYNRVTNWKSRKVLLPLHLRVSDDSYHISITKEWTNTSVSLTLYGFVSSILTHRYCTFIPVNSTARHISQYIPCPTWLKTIYLLSIYNHQQSRDVWMNTEYCWFWHWCIAGQIVTAKEYHNVIRKCEPGKGSLRIKDALR